MKKLLSCEFPLLQKNRCIYLAEITELSNLVDGRSFLKQQRKGFIILTE